MDGSNTRCASCGASIRQRTADKHFGLCSSCYADAVTKPPDGFAVPDDLVQRITAHGGDPQRFREMVWRDGADSVHAFLNRIEGAADEYRRWSPRLVAFAADCRRTVPVPAIESLTRSEREQYRLLRKNMARFARSEEYRVVLMARPLHLAILSTSLVGLVAAHEVFRGSDAVILETSERHRFFAETHASRHLACCSFAFAWWSVEEQIAPEQAVRILERHPLPEGSSYWLLRSGVRWHPLAGGGHDEVWRWDGHRAHFVESLLPFCF